MDKELVEKARAVMRQAAAESPLKAAPVEPVTGNLQDAVKDVFSVKGSCQLELFVRETAPCPSGPVSVNRGLTILDPARFVSATLADLAGYVAAKNQGHHYSWIEDLLDEKIADLRLCGVEAEIRTVQ